MNNLRARILCLLAGIGISFVFGPAQALNTNTVLFTCDSCQTPIDFRNAAVSQSNIVDQSALTYVAIGGSSPGMSAYVYIDGYWITDPFTGQNYWNVDTARMMDQNGATLSTDVPTAQAQMSVIDVGIFGYTRGSTSPKVATIQMPSDYDGSFIGSTEEYDSPGIGAALIRMSINQALFAVGAKLLVKYQDGTKAVFVKIQDFGDYQWAWDGIHAWNAQGKPIDRNGNLRSNPNTSGTGGGSTSASEILDGAGNAAALWFIYQQQQCTTSTQLSINGVVDSTFFGFVPC